MLAELERSITETCPLTRSKLAAELLRADALALASPNYVVHLALYCEQLASRGTFAP